MVTLTSSNEYFAGTVVLPDALTFPQLIAWEDAVAGATQADQQMAVSYRNLLPGVLAVVREWHIANIPDKPTVHNFPATPWGEVTALLGWLGGEIVRLIAGGDAVGK